MSDIMPNVDLRKKRIQVKIAEMELSLDRMDLRKMELADELTAISKNEEASLKSIDELKKELEK